MLVIGIVSQKGGVGKSTISRMLAREYAQSWDVLIADMDLQQGTSTDWYTRRLENEVEPQFSVQKFSTVNKALAQGTKYDLIIFDGAPHATTQTKQIAEASHFVILPAGNSKDDLIPQIRLAHELSNIVDLKRLSFMLMRVGDSDAENEGTQEWIEQAGYRVLKGTIPERTAYRLAMDTGKTLTETSFKTLNEKADKVVQAVIDEFKNLTK
jgi:chromosome partitioning protein